MEKFEIIVNLIVIGETKESTIEKLTEELAKIPFIKDFRIDVVTQK